MLGSRKTEIENLLFTKKTNENHSNVEIDIRKRRANLYRHIHRLSVIRPTQQTHNTTSTLNDTTNCVIEHRKDLRISYKK